MICESGADAVAGFNGAHRLEVRKAAQKTCCSLGAATVMAQFVKMCLAQMSPTLCARTRPSECVRQTLVAIPFISHHRHLKHQMHSSHHMLSNGRRLPPATLAISNTNFLSSLHMLSNCCRLHSHRSAGPNGEAGSGCPSLPSRPCTPAWRLSPRLCHLKHPFYDSLLRMLSNCHRLNSHRSARRHGKKG